MATSPLTIDGMVKNIFENAWLIERFKKKVTDKGYQWFDDNKPYQLNIIGVREIVKGVVDKFDDAIVLIFRDDKLNQQLKCWSATTKPGLFWLEHPENHKGTSIMVPGQYVGAWKIGLHKGEYEALVQVLPIKVYRDNNKDDHYDLGDPKVVDEGVFGVNIHRSNPSRSSQQVDKWSAGCQVFQNPTDFKTFMGLCHKSFDIHKKPFTYTLLNIEDLTG